MYQVDKSKQDEFNKKFGKKIPKKASVYFEVEYDEYFVNENNTEGRMETATVYHKNGKDFFHYEIKGWEFVGSKV